MIDGEHRVSAKRVFLTRSGQQQTGGDVRCEPPSPVLGRC